MTEEKTPAIIPLKKGVSISYKAKRYTQKTGIPETLFSEIYSEGEVDENKKLTAKGKEKVAKYRKKFEFVPEPEEIKEPEKPKK